jgi:hypothetical protein
VKRQALAAVVAISFGALPAAQQDVSLPTVLLRLHRYLADYAERIPATIATEHYEQSAGRTALREQVALESEFGIMRLDGSGGWLGLRDVLRVNGKAVADHAERLQQLFTNPSARELQQARKIASENARFNVGRIQRTINDPAVVLELLDSRNASRMRFTKAGETTINSMSVWVIRYEEKQRPTIIRTPEGRDQRSTGRAWVEPVSGRLVRADLTIESPTDRVGTVTRFGFTATLDVTFGEEPRLGFWVPLEMTERYEGRDGSICTGSATYSNYRRFGVQTRLIPNP